MRKQIQESDVQAPERLMAALVSDYIEGNLSDNRLLYRAVVSEVDLMGGQFESNPDNPRNSIRALVFTDQRDFYTSIDDLPVFWPLFSHLQMPIKEGEHVYVLFEDDAKEHGLWMTRLPSQLDCDSKNYAVGLKPYVSDPGNQVTDISAGQILYNTPNNFVHSQEFVVEDEPDFDARIGDFVLHGSNNAKIILGRDRPNTKESGEIENAGTIDIVTGRTSGSTDLNFETDKSRIYVSSKTDVDLNCGTQQIGSVAPEVAEPGPAVAVISDEIRLVARNGLKICVQNGTLTIDGSEINIGSQASQHAVLGEQLVSLLSNIINLLSTGLLAPPGTAGGPVSLGPTGVPLKTTIETQLQQILSTTVTVKS